jgi:hypothetical protein
MKWNGRIFGRFQPFEDVRPSKAKEVQSVLWNSVFLPLRNSRHAGFAQARHCGSSVERINDAHGICPFLLDMLGIHSVILSRLN